jgi:hypothetical protein
MTYGLSFSNDFLTGGGSELRPSPHPTSVLQAILSLSDDERSRMARDVFRVTPDRLSSEMILDRVVATNTCENLDSPVRVWIDSAGLHTLLVHDHERLKAPKLSD